MLAHCENIFEKRLDKRKKCAMLRAALEKNTQPLGYPRTENWRPRKNRQPNNVRLGTKNVDEKKPGKNRAE